MATLSTAEFVRKVNACVLTFAHRLSAAEMGAVITVFSQVPARSVATARHARQVFAVMSAVAVLRPDGLPVGIPNDALANALGVSANPQTWLTTQTVDTWLRRITTEVFNKA